MQIRAAFIESWGQPPVVAALDLPDPGPGETLVRLTSAIVSHLDRTIASGGFGIRPTLPYVAGTEGIGVVTRSETFSPGTHVAIRGGGVGTKRPGCWAEMAVVPDRALIEIDPEGAELVGAYLGPATAAHVALHAVARFQTGEVAVVTGAAGAVGSMAVQLALRAGASNVVAVVGRPEHASRVVPDAELLVAGPDELEVIRASGATTLVDTVGGPQLAGRITAIAPGGRAVLVGYTAGTELKIELPSFLLDDVSILPLNMMRRSPDADAVTPELTALLRRGELAGNLQRFPLERAAAAVAALADGSAGGRVLLDVTS